MTRRGWTSTDLKVVGDDPNLWTVADAAGLLGPPVLTADQVRQLVRMTAMQPVGKRKTGAQGKPGRYARVYPAAAFIQAYDRLSEAA